MKTLKIFALIAASLAFASCSNKFAKTNAADSSKTSNSSSAAQINKNEGKVVIYFDTDSFKLSETAISDIEKVAVKFKTIAKNKKATIKIEGHCDERGTNAYNKKLGQKRADAVKSLLRKQLSKNVKITTISYGKSRPVALGHNEESWSQNRRSIIISIE